MDVIGRLRREQAVESTKSRHSRRRRSSCQRILKGGDDKVRADVEAEIAALSKCIL
jgi:hypothetical protein